MSSKYWSRRRDATNWHYEVSVHMKDGEPKAMVTVNSPEHQDVAERIEAIEGAELMSRKPGRHHPDKRVWKRSEWLVPVGAVPEVLS